MFPLELQTLIYSWITPFDRVRLRLPRSLEDQIYLYIKGGAIQVKVDPWFLTIMITTPWVSDIYTDMGEALVELTRYLNGEWKIMDYPGVFRGADNLKKLEDILRGACDNERTRASL